MRLTLDLPLEPLHEPPPSAMELFDHAEALFEECLQTLVLAISSHQKTRNAETFTAQSRAIDNVTDARAACIRAWATDPRRSLAEIRMRQGVKVFGALAAFSSPAALTQRLDELRAAP